MHKNAYPFVQKDGMSVDENTVTVGRKSGSKYKEDSILSFYALILFLRVIMYVASVKFGYFFICVSIGGKLTKLIPLMILGRPFRHEGEV
jgi:hypothetical protein